MNVGLFNIWYRVVVQLSKNIDQIWNRRLWISRESRLQAAS